MFFIICMLLKNIGQKLSRISLNLGLSEVFSWLDWLMGLGGRRPQRWHALLTHRTGGTCYPCDITGDIGFDHLVEVGSACFLLCKVSRLLFPVHSLFFRSSLPWRGGEEFSTTSWVGSNSSERRICTFFAIYSFIQSSIYISMDSSMFTYYFGLQTNNAIYLVAQTVPDLTIGNSFSWLLWPFRHLPCARAFVCVRACTRACVRVCVCSTSFMVLQDAPSSGCIFSSPALESATSPRSPTSFYWISGIWELRSWQTCEFLTGRVLIKFCISGFS